MSLSDTQWYHVANRCVRRAFLCEADALTGQDFDHRRGWIETRIRELASVFTIDVAACAIMSANLHAAASIVQWYGTDFNPSQAGFAQELAATSGSGAQLHDEGFDAFCA